MSASLDSLGPELIHLVVYELEKLVGPARLPPYALVNKRFQAAFRRREIAWLEVSSHGSRESLLTVVGKRPVQRRALSSLQYTTILPTYPDDHRYCLEKRKEHKANLAAFEKSVTALWNELSSWTDKAPGSLRLELTAKSETDDWTDWDFDNEARWLYREYSLALGDESVKLPTLDCVYNLVLGAGRRIHPRTMGDMILSLPCLRSLDLRLPPGHARNRALRAEYRIHLAKALEAPTLHRLENLSIDMAEETPENHDFQVAEQEDPAYPAGDVLCHAIRKLAQRSLRELRLEGCPISPALFTSGKKKEDEAGFPYLESLKITYPIYTYDGRWYYGGNPATYKPEELHEKELEKIEWDTEDEGRSDDESDRESVASFSNDPWREPLNRDRADFFDGNLPEYAWRRRPEPKTFNPLVKSLAKAALRMPKLRSLVAIAKAQRPGLMNQKRMRDLHIKFLAPGADMGFAVKEHYELIGKDGTNWPDIEQVEKDKAKWRWAICLGPDINSRWTLPKPTVALMKERVGEEAPFVHLIIDFLIALLTGTSPATTTSTNPTVSTINTSLSATTAITTTSTTKTNLQNPGEDDRNDPPTSQSLPDPPNPGTELTSYLSTISSLLTSTNTWLSHKKSDTTGKWYKFAKIMTAG
ncbi:uncharacterized protein DSM5745_07505 [Aspergillus mulundensis]|uniref:F-box domain-containing protein n=1 Tax=Aspergillus mulundensis TaxID=1810919 RepID=A0A3D8RE37_9EURO|nr:hypothetical protein DSM5745_07505 [Aspergillus mulundensis]RDW72333.1 hypothetical protein DSM5745_07505 [Aspergillus mulundensis]